MDITPRHIEQIEALRRSGSFRKAAEKLHISQPALSRSILLLEEKLGVSFFDRMRGRLELTRYGRIVLDRGEGVLKELGMLHRDIHLLRGGEQGLLHVGCGPIPAETLAGGALARFSRLYPQMAVKIILDKAPHLTAMLDARSIDFFVGETSQIADAQGYDMISLPQQQGYFCCRNGHPLTSKACLTVEDILKYPLALLWLSDRIYGLFEKILGRSIQSNEDFSVGHVECDNISLLLRVASGGDAVAVTTREILAESAYEDALTLLPLVIPEFKTGYSVVSLKGYSEVPAITRLKELFLETAEKTVRTA